MGMDVVFALDYFMIDQHFVSWDVASEKQLSISYNKNLEGK